MMQVASQPRAGIVSCDIIGHSRVPSRDVQAERIEAINAIVSETVVASRPGSVAWASGGDGGHVVFLSDDWQQGALGLIERLRRWATSALVPLRVTAHVGDVGLVRGLDDRREPVGDGINEAGAILALGTGRGVVVSQELRREIEKLEDDRVHFHGQRSLRTKMQERELLLLSLPDLPSEWDGYIEDDRARLKAALARGAAWDVLYHAKRILQAHSADHDVDIALRRLNPDDYWSAQPGGTGGRVINPLLGYLDARSLREVIRLGQLVERGYNETICRYDDEGNTMFVILRGQVGVFNVDGDERLTDGEPSFVLREGAIVGELSFALKRRRTADLVCLGDTALLAFSFEELARRLADAPAGADILKAVNRFITSRVLSHVAHAVPFLIDVNRTGPLAAGEEPWESLLDDLLFDCRTLSWTPADGPLSVEALGINVREPAPTAGMCFLTTGALESSSNPRKIVEGDRFPLLYLDLPDIAIPDHEYVVTQGAAGILQIGSRGISSLPPNTHNAVIRTLRQSVAPLYFYDAFLSFNYGDEETVERWRTELVDAGLVVYVESLHPGVKFVSKIENALMDSLTVVAFISPHTMVKDEDQNWVRKEIEFREKHFTNPWIIPVRLRGGKPEVLKLTYTMIDATAGEENAIQQTIAIIAAIRHGADDPPLPKGRKIVHHME
jgi:hypothetical protein